MEEIIYEEYPPEEIDLMRRIKNLRIDQIAALIELVGIHFDKQDLEDVAKRIKNSEEDDTDYVDIIIDEASSREELEFWLNFFEKYNKT
jgi:isopropylmalate/homocitrate/citramalate synthase